ncbi:MAG: MgtC/SapB family protein [Gammaproteobacteria bacterium]|nr:MgtC/SapB family protein [Gammaproteobacteria bacterium]
MEADNPLAPLLLLAIALAQGLLIGLERGWKSRTEEEGQRIAGLRTFGLIGLLGGASALLSRDLGTPALGFVFIGVAAAAIVAYSRQAAVGADFSITSLVTILLTFVLGALVALGHVVLGTSAAVITTLLLGFKDELHGWMRRLTRTELQAAFKLLLISVVLLPVLPNRGFGPWQALNPYEIWWMVVLIAGISFCGYFMMKIAGPGKGVLLTALAAGFVSSTALTLEYSHLSRSRTDLHDLLAAGVLIACGTMFPRILLVATIINPAMFQALALPMLVMTLLIFTAALIYWRRSAETPPVAVEKVSNPLELKPALFFGGVLAAVILLSKWVEELLGEQGIYILAAVSGIADVDPISLSLARMSKVSLGVGAAVLGILIAASVNTLVKSTMALVIGRAAFGLRVMLPLLLAIAAGIATAFSV